MSTETLITEGLRKCLGLETEPVVIEIDKTLLSRFADAVGDHNPLWTDVQRAAEGPYGTLTAPPSLLGTATFMGNSPVLQITHLLPSRMLDGGGEWEYFKPIKLGDRITVRPKLAEMVERPGRVGAMLILTTETTWHNQRNELVAKARSSLIRY